MAPSEALKQIRADAISILEHMVGSAADDAERSVILQALRQASRPPYHGGNAALRTIVMEDARRVVAIEQTVASNGGLEVRRQMEVHALDVHYWYGELPRDMASDATLVAAQKCLISELLKLRDHLNDDQDYVLYKLLIGHDSVRPGAWTGEHYEPEATDSWRKAAWPEILNLVDAEGAAAWTARMRRYLAIRPEPGAGFPLLNFSQHLGQVRPDVALHLLGDMDDTLSMLLLSLLIGLDRAGRTSDALAAVNAWISQGRFLAIMAEWLATHAKPDTGRLMAVAGRACELDDHQAAITTANAAAKLWDKLHDQRLIEDVFLPCVAYLAAAGQTNWLRHAWDVRQGGLVDALDENQTKSFLASFADAETIEYDSDRILAAVAVRRPELVLDFFEERLRRPRRDHAGRFDAIPFRLHELPKALSRYPNLLVSATRRWFDFDPQLHQFRGGRLFANVFSTLTDDVISQLRALIAAGDRDDLAFVLATLRPYEGREEIYPICMDVVDRLPAGDKLLQHVSEVLSETGVVSGEFGFVEAEGKLYELLGRYVDDERANVRAFAQDTRRRTEQSMAWEQRRAEQELEQMRRDWA